MWKLFTDRGQQVWKYLKSEPATPLPPFNPERNPNAADRVYRSQAEQANFKELKENDLTDLMKKAVSLQNLPSDELTGDALKTWLKAVNYYQSVQMEDGHWPGDYGGPMFLLPGFVITAYVTGVQFSPEQKEQLLRYLFNHQMADGGWGLHIEEHSTMFGTVLNYITVRLLGIPKDDERIQNARRIINDLGGAMYCPSWGKFWLCVLGVYEWGGCNSIFPELWLFPEKLPFHPWRWWCHCRMVYLPMAYIYGHKVTGKITPLVLELRKEIYPQPYESYGDFSRFRDSIAKVDLYTPQTTILKVLNFFTNSYEKFHSKYIRQKALDFILEYIHAEDEQTKYVDIGPVNKAINMLSVWHACGSESEHFKGHVARFWDYLYLAEDGMKAQGYNGSQLWDTAFAVQAITESGLSGLFENCLKKAYHYLEISQVLEDVKDRERFYRHISKGGWPFSTRDHGWPISDCTAEGIKATIALQEKSEYHDAAPLITNEEAKLIDISRLDDAVNVILSFQNDDGGWATYENTRGPAWLEYINPAEVFGGIMIDYSYTECSSASLQSLVSYLHAYPEHAKKRRAEIERSIQRGCQFIKSKQREDGSWYGSWAVCFTYGAWFAIEGLIAGGIPASDPAIQKGIKFLLDRQNEDGGWGESYKACRDKVWSPRESQVVNTSWALLALMKAGVYKTHPERIIKGIKLLQSRQMANGDWDQEGISGVFNGNCMITYINYRNIFPIWAISRYLQVRKQSK